MTAKPKLTAVKGGSSKFVDLDSIHQQVIALPDRNAKMLAASLAFVRSGIAIVPLAKKGTRLGGKSATGKEIHPGFGGYNNALLTELKVIEHWSQGGKYEGCGIGLACGPPRGDVPRGSVALFVIDIDRPAPGSEKANGFESLSELEDRLGTLPNDTPMMNTPRGGRHVLFEWSDGLENTSGNIALGIDSRGGTYKDGRWGRAGHVTYDPDLGYSPECNGYLRNLPVPWREAFIRSKKPSFISHGDTRGQVRAYADMDLGTYVDEIDAIPEGQRNEVLFRLGLSVLSKSGGDRAHVTAVLEMANSKCDPPLPDEELRQILKSIDTSDVARNLQENDELADEWQRTEKGKIAARNEINANVAVSSRVFLHEWNVEFDEFYWRETVNRELLTNVMATKIRQWLGRRFKTTFAKEHVNDALALVADGRRTHAFRSWLHALPDWDKKSRFRTLAELLYAEDDERPDWERELDEHVLRKTLISAVHRAHDVWEKVRHMTILIGEQDAGKSDLWKFLCPILGGTRAFVDSLSFTSLSRGSDGMRDMNKQMAGCVFAEFAEMTGLQKQQEAAVKQWLSGQAGSYVNKYQVYAEKEPQRCVAVGTGNRVGQFKDDSGLSRWQPIAVTQSVIDTGWITENLEQLWAEALHQYRAGEKHFFEKGEAEYERLQDRAKRYTAVWGDTAELSDIIARQDPPFDKEFLSIDEVMDACVQIQRDDLIAKVPARSEQVSALTSAGWQPTTDPVHNRPWRFKVTDADVDEFPAHVLQKSKGQLRMIVRGFVHPDFWEQIRELSPSDRAREILRRELT